MFPKAQTLLTSIRCAFAVQSGLKVCSKSATCSAKVRKNRKQTSPESPSPGSSLSLSLSLGFTSRFKSQEQIHNISTCHIVQLVLRVPCLTSLGLQQGEVMEIVLNSGSI